jgi:hypothetical protein
MPQTNQPVQDDFDTPWKDILEHYLPEFFAFFFPAIHAAIDWEQPHRFLDKELQQITRDALAGRRVVDKLVSVMLRDGTESWILIHIEIQNQKEQGFNERMFVYHYRIYDIYQRPIVSLAILGDRDNKWRPASFSYDLWGCGVHFWFPIVKLRDYAGQQLLLEHNKNPFATVVMAHLAAQKTRSDIPSRAVVKYKLTRRLYELGYQRDDIINLYRFIDWLLRLPEEVEQHVLRQIQRYEEVGNMPYISTAERLGLQQGLERGLQQGLERGLQQGLERGLQQGLEQGRHAAAHELVMRLVIKRCGPLDPQLVEQIEALSTKQLDDLALATLDFADSSDLLRWLADHASVPDPTPPAE